ncbi:conserved domain protein [Bacteroides fluxus YIT 12057]|jgi:hypothetical protein|uniref:Conserved domain protein n=1 Tax=Bacteroides fluxus YIT 12057 TaxID=763034 RepID=F3PUM2_9BACE|nr:conserved domain protein [Bacteroides fluxus YIT 12057]
MSIKKNIFVEVVIFFVTFLCFKLFSEGLSIATIATTFIASIIFLIILYAIKLISKKQKFH